MLLLVKRIVSWKYRESGSDEQESSSNLASSHDHTISDASELSDEHPPSGHSSIDCIAASGSDNDASGAIPGRQNLSDADAVGSRVSYCFSQGCLMIRNWILHLILHNITLLQHTISLVK